MSEAVNERSGVLMSIRGVTKAFGSNVVLKGINMDVKAGEVIALIGGNGAGKSTLMKIIMGIYDLDEGEIFMAGQPVKLGKPSASLAQGIYLVPQEPMLFPNMTVLENVLMGFNENEAELKKRLQKHMEELGFTLNLQRKASTLSIAEQQLVEILRGLMREARLLILDEPTSGIDAAARSDVYGIIRQLKEEGVAVLMVSSDIEEVVELADRAITIFQGRINGEFSHDEISQDALTSASFGIGHERVVAK